MQTALLVFFISFHVFKNLGTEWNYVILSLVRSLMEDEIEKRPSIGWLQKQLGFITDQNQINVALTRAKRGLILIGECNYSKSIQLLIVLFFMSATK